MERYVGKHQKEPGHQTRDTASPVDYVKSPGARPGRARRGGAVAEADQARLTAALGSALARRGNPRWCQAPTQVNWAVRMHMARDPVNLESRGSEVQLKEKNGTFVALRSLYMRMDITRISMTIDGSILSTALSHFRW